MSDTIRFTLNGTPVALETDAARTLLWVLRTDLGLTGTKYGCGAGFCGSCTVVVDGQAVRSCLTDVNAVQGKQVKTIEGLATNGRLHPLQQAFNERGGFQCGYCTPGMIMNAYALLLERPSPTREQIVQGMENNLCRCSAYHRIVEAIEVASGQTGGSHE
jgi:aerobic-type carbon monoxide dehydrogenase small subunit (CoxS/CutS family)